MTSANHRSERQVSVFLVFTVVVVCTGFLSQAPEWQVNETRRRRYSFPHFLARPQYIEQINGDNDDEAA